MSQKNQDNSKGSPLAGTTRESCTAIPASAEANTSGQLLGPAGTTSKRKEIPHDDEVVAENSNSDTIAASPPMAAGLPPAKMKLMLANREHARTSHLRKKKMVEDLKTNLSKLEDENKQLQEENIALKARQISSMNYTNTIVPLTAPFPPPQIGNVGPSRMLLEARELEENKRLREENIALKAHQVRCINYANAMASLSSMPVSQGHAYDLSHIPLHAHQSLLETVSTSTAPMLHSHSVALGSLATSRRAQSVSQPDETSPAFGITGGVSQHFPPEEANNFDTKTDADAASDGPSAHQC